MPDYVGQQFGNYRLISLIGYGGSAEVYLGEHIYLNSKAALKIAHYSLHNDEQEHFLAEARLLSSLSHQHIIRVLDFGLRERLPFLVMEYAAHGSLRQRHPRGSILPLQLITSYVLQASEALQYAHEQKFVHRDIKPENMLLRQLEEVVLTDFGIATMSHSTLSQSTQDMAGTAAYMAPEQITGKPRPASDQYALGIIVFEWLTGAPPFDGPFFQVVGQHIHAAVPSLKGLSPHYTPELDQVIQTALAKDPHQRFASIKAFANALHQACFPQPSSPSSFSTLHSPPSYISLSSTPTLLSLTPPSTPSLSSDAHSSTLSPASPHITDASVFPSHNIQAASPHHTPFYGQEVSGASLPVTPLPSSSILSTDARSPQSNMSVPGEAIPRPARRFPRRSLLAGVAGLVTIAAGGFFWLKSHYDSQTPPQTRSIVKGTATYGTMFGMNPQHTHFNPDERILSPSNVNRLREAWIAPLGVIGLSSPILVKDTIYVGSLDKTLYAVNVSNGAVRWKFSTGSEIYSTPAVVNDVVYIASYDHNVYAISAADGKQLWRKELGNVVFPSPLVVDGIIYIGSHDNTFYALDATDGTIRWRHQTQGPIESSAAFDNGIVYVGSKDTFLYAFRASDGTVLWQQPTKGEIFSSPAVSSGRVYVGSKDYAFYAFDARTGTKLWSKETGHYVNSSPSVASDIVYIGSKDAKIYALDARNGQSLWEFTAGSEVASSAAIANGVVYFGSWDHYFYAVDARTGRQLWKTSTGEGIESSPTVFNGVVYFGSRDGRLYAYTLPAS